MYTLKRSIVVPTTMEEAWDFIRKPQNLNLITPDDMVREELVRMNPKGSKSAKD